MRQSESYSDVVNRLAGERFRREVAGIWADETDDVVEAIEAGRVRSRERRDQLL